MLLWGEIIQVHGSFKRLAVWISINFAPLKGKAAIFIVLTPQYLANYQQLDIGMGFVR